MFKKLADRIWAATDSIWLVREAWFFDSQGKRSKIYLVRHTDGKEEEVPEISVAGQVIGEMLKGKEISDVQKTE